MVVCIGAFSQHSRSMQNSMDYSHGQLVMCIDWVIVKTAQYMKLPYTEQILTTFYSELPTDSSCLGPHQAHYDFHITFHLKAFKLEMPGTEPGPLYAK